MKKLNENKDYGPNLVLVELFLNPTSQEKRKEIKTPCQFKWALFFCQFRSHSHASLHFLLCVNFWELLSNTDHTTTSLR